MSRVSIHQPLFSPQFGSSNIASGIKERKTNNSFGLMEKLSNSPEKIGITEQKYKTGAGNIERRRLLLAVNVPTLERLQ